MRKMKVLPVIKLMLTTVSKGKLDNGRTLCFRYIGMKTKLGRCENAEKEKTG
jgi:hypothetical protein